MRGGKVVATFRNRTPSFNRNTVMIAENLEAAYRRTRWSLIVRGILGPLMDLYARRTVHGADVFARLDANGETPVTTGFVIGAGERRYRGQLSAVRAPVTEPELLMAFVFNG